MSFRLLMLILKKKKRKKQETSTSMRLRLSQKVWAKISLSHLYMSCKILKKNKKKKSMISSTNPTHISYYPHSFAFSDIVHPIIFNRLKLIRILRDKHLSLSLWRKLLSTHLSLSIYIYINPFTTFSLSQTPNPNSHSLSVLCRGSSVFSQQWLPLLWWLSCFSPC